jgi:hypothetical protein
VAGFGAHVPAANAAGSDYLMCGWTVAPRTQTVYIDSSVERAGVSKEQVLAAFQSWNNLFEKYHGFPIFTEAPSASKADVVVEGRVSQRTWTDSVCNPAFRSSGQVTSIVHLGVKDSWRNARIVAHELGHTLGFADFGNRSQHVAGHIGFQPCGSYYGVMSYCTSQDMWFMDEEIRGMYLDGQLVRDYWN